MVYLFYSYAGIILFRSEGIISASQTTGTPWLAFCKPLQRYEKSRAKQNKIFIFLPRRSTFGKARGTKNINKQHFFYNLCLNFTQVSVIFAEIIIILWLKTY